MSSTINTAESLNGTQLLCPKLLLLEGYECQQDAFITLVAPNGEEIWSGLVPKSSTIQFRVLRQTSSQLRELVSADGSFRVTLPES